MVDPQYGMYVWPSAPVLAQYVWNNRTSVKGKKILEVNIKYHEKSFFLQDILVKTLNEHCLA
jgi:hypothetical protein